MKRNILILAISCFCALSVAQTVNYRIIPLPQHVLMENGSPFILNKKVKITYPAGNEKMKRNACFLASYLKEVTRLNYSMVTAKGQGCNVIVLSLGLISTNSEAYQLKITDRAISIIGATEAGVFYGIQTLRKSLPVRAKDNISFPRVEINDAPRFSYRGMMLDVARHFFTVDEVKTFIDILALHNINRFHWHLTDDQGWRIEIKKYPRLTGVGSKRDSTVIGHNTGRYDGKPYGGFYTQEQAKEIVKYAADRYVTVIPEIDMPGHMIGALAAYPELGCTGGPYKVWGKWGVSEDVLCAGNDKVLTFIDDVLGELINVFPSEYIHVGGDECPRTKWKSCPKCQARIKELGLKNDGTHSAEDKLESFIIAHAERFLNDHGRKMIGWDEILEGQLAPNATVMSWRGLSGGIEAAKLRHNVIMTPNTSLYFDHYQTNDIKDEPLAIGGYLPLKDVYATEPVPEALADDEKHYIIGVQANLWTEYIPYFKQVEYMLMPRVAALAEVQWTQPSKKNYEDFLTRLPKLLAIYDVQDYNYAKHVFGLTTAFCTNILDKSLDVNISTIDNADIHYTLDGTDPTGVSSLLPNGLLKIRRDCILKAIAIRPNANSRVFTQQITFNKASLKPIFLYQPIDKKYFYQGAQTLVDGLSGDGNYASGRWVGFCGDDMVAVVDLGVPTQISSSAITACVQKGAWAFDARGFFVEISDDGFNFTKIASDLYSPMKPTDPDGCIVHKLSFPSVMSRYIKLTVLSEHSLPSWHIGASGMPGYLFVDEIVVN
jgi:hexosaminidase